MTQKEFTNIRSLLGALAKAMNLINPEVEHHHEQTAYFSYFTALQMGLDTELIHTIIYAALLHDVGSTVLERKASVAEIEQDAEKYAKLGSYMLQDLPEFTEIAAVIEFCQSDWDEISKEFSPSDEAWPYIRLGAVIHIADFASLCMNRNKRILNQVDDICENIKKRSGKEFMPEAVEAFLKLRPIELVWLDAMENPDYLFYFTGDLHKISLEKAAALTKLMSRIIDFRSSFTAMHSAGVAASAVELARLAGMSEEDCLKMKIAGYLHDVGKLVVPRAILEKPGKLTPEEFNVIKEHPYYTRLVLKDIDGFEEITNWASLHHEKLDGNGYPFHFNAEQLDLGSRIMAVADIFSAITEVRPYRDGMKKDKAIQVLQEDVAKGAICSHIVDLLIANYEQIDSARDLESRKEGKRYFDDLNADEL